MTPIEQYWEWDNQVGQFVENTKIIWGDESIDLQTKKQMISNGMKQVTEGLLITLAVCRDDPFLVHMLRSKGQQAFTWGLRFTGMTDYSVDPTYQTQQ